MKTRHRVSPRRAPRVAIRADVCDATHLGQVASEGVRFPSDSFKAPPHVRGNFKGTIESADEAIRASEVHGGRASVHLSRGDAECGNLVVLHDCKGEPPSLGGLASLGPVVDVLSKVADGLVKERLDNHSQPYDACVEFLCLPRCVSRV